MNHYLIFRDGTGSGINYEYWLGSALAKTGTIDPELLQETINKLTGVENIKHQPKKGERNENENHA